MGDLLELLDWSVVALAGWRYLLSPAYRRRVHKEWRDEAWYYIAWDVLCGIAGIAFTLLVFFAPYRLLSHALGG